MIWGTGVGERWFKSFLKENDPNLEITGFVDDAPNSHFRSNYDGTRVFTSAALLSTYELLGRPLIFLGNNRHIHDRARALLAQGLKQNEDFFQAIDFPDYRIDWVGFYSTWAEATRDSQGYEDPVAVSETARTNIGPPNKEQDPTMTSADQRLLAPLAIVLATMGTKLRVVDFGGGLASHFLQVRRHLPHVQLTWQVVETKTLVKIGRECSRSDGLSFVSDLDEIQSPVDLILASSSLQYVEDARRTFHRLERLGARFLLIDRTPLSNLPEDKVLVQRVCRLTDRGNYETGYPLWLLSRTIWEQEFFRHHRKLAEWRLHDQTVDLEEERIHGVGFLCERI